MEARVGDCWCRSRIAIEHAELVHHISDLLTLPEPYLRLGRYLMTSTFGWKQVNGPKCFNASNRFKNRALIKFVQNGE